MMLNYLHGYTDREVNEIPLIGSLRHNRVGNYPTVQDYDSDKTPVRKVSSLPKMCFKQTGNTAKNAYPIYHSPSSAKKVKQIVKFD